MYPAIPRRRSASAASTAQIETLEGRQLLSGEPWSGSAHLIGLDQAVAHYPQLTGAGEAIAIIDSGVDYKHPSLGGGFGPNYKVEAGYDFQSNDADPMSDTNAHGTGAAGVISANPYVYKSHYNQGIAPGVRLIALRQNNSTGVKNALDWVIANRTKYNIVGVNITGFGGSSTVYKAELQNLIAQGVFFSRPAGNGGATAPMGASMDPADFVVGGVNLNDQMSSFSQRGADLDLVAPAENVSVPYYDVAKKTQMYVDTGQGTSWASPAAVGTAALIKQIDPRFTPAQMMQIMQDSGKPIYDAVSKRTYKRLNVDAALTLAYARRGGAAQTPQPPLSTGVTSGTGSTTTTTAARALPVFGDGDQACRRHDARGRELRQRRGGRLLARHRRRQRRRQHLPRHPRRRAECDQRRRAPRLVHQGRRVPRLLDHGCGRGHVRPVGQGRILRRGRHVPRRGRRREQDRRDERPGHQGLADVDERDEDRRQPDGRHARAAAEDGHGGPARLRRQLRLAAAGRQDHHRNDADARSDHPGGGDAQRLHANLGRQRQLDLVGRRLGQGRARLARRGGLGGLPVDRLRHDRGDHVYRERRGGDRVRGQANPDPPGRPDRHADRHADRVGDRKLVDVQATDHDDHADDRRANRLPRRHRRRRGRQRAVAEVRVIQCCVGVPPGELLRRVSPRQEVIDALVRRIEKECKQTGVREQAGMLIVGGTRASTEGVGRFLEELDQPAKP